MLGVQVQLTSIVQTKISDRGVFAALKDTIPTDLALESPLADLQASTFSATELVLAPFRADLARRAVLAEMGCNEDKAIEVVKSHLKMIDAVLHGSEGNGKLLWPIRLGLELMDLPRLSIEWPALALGCAQRILHGRSPMPTRVELGEWLAPVLPALMCDDNQSLSWNAGHVAWHLREYGGREMAERAGRNVEEFLPVVDPGYSESELKLLQDLHELSQKKD